MLGKNWLMRVVFGDLSEWIAMDPFGVGQVVGWYLKPVVNREYLDLVLGPATSATVTDLVVNSPDLVPPWTVPTRSTVKAIRAVYSHVELRHDSRLDRDVFWPIAGSSVLEHETFADARRLWRETAASRDDFRGFLGFVVDLEDI
jgi:hypothetical protein